MFWTLTEAINKIGARRFNAIWNAALSLSPFSLLVTESEPKTHNASRVTPSALLQAHLRRAFKDYYPILDFYVAVMNQSYRNYPWVAGMPPEYRTQLKTNWRFIHVIPMLTTENFHFRLLSSASKLLIKTSLALFAFCSSVISTIEYIGNSGNSKWEGAFLKPSFNAPFGKIDNPIAARTAAWMFAMEVPVNSTSHFRLAFSRPSVAIFLKLHGDGNKTRCSTSWRDTSVSLPIN